ncbi:hypothetical protein TRFO_28569 [Tritrichomonas foetus]|uniref:Piezo non-specific cation channel cap domain-containing protein n=1 Tax=Tritrichomonas foetus TaxID=1144522 RepID=A0A1J4JXY9_9EUKA|nr:hypothetical protein TRFO_28569 [Tritrichomonas foetus]|eukprot:OHT04025.1 hypothetical protein TRFO_28569 [Tritrichomonas foetus]
MEVSDQSNSIDSDSFFAVNTIHESVTESQSSEEVVIPLQKYNPIILVIFIDFIIPFLLFLCAISTTSIAGLYFILILLIHIFICSKLTNRFLSLSCILYVEIFSCLFLFVIALVSSADNDGPSFVSNVLGFSFKTYVSHDIDFATISSVIAVIAQSISVTLKGHITASSYSQKRRKIVSNYYFTYFIDIVHIFSIAFLASTNISYIFIPVFIYFIYINLAFTFCGHDCIATLLKKIATFYTLIYSFYEFYMMSYIGEKWNPEKYLGYQFIGPEPTKAADIAFSVILAYTSLTIITDPNLDKRGNNPVPFIMKNITRVLIVLLIGGLYAYILFFPNYLTILWLIIIFFCTFSDFETISKFFFPFLGFIYTITFSIVAITQFDMFPHPLDNGSEQPLSFMKLFGLFRYQKEERFEFCCPGFIFMTVFGFIGRIKHSENTTPTFCSTMNSSSVGDSGMGNFSSSQEINMNQNYVNQSKYEQDQANFDESSEHNHHFLKTMGSIFKATVNFIAVGLKLLHHFIYRILTYFSLPVCTVLGIYAGFFTTRWAFQVLAFFMVCIVLLFQYFRWAYEFVKLISCLIILVCAFYKSSSDSYYCRGDTHCLFYGYFIGIEDSGLCPPPETSLHSFCWSISCVFILSVFITYEEKSLRIYYPSIVVALLYILIAVCDFIYVFLYDLQVFTLVYFFIGCLIIAFQCLSWNSMRTVMIMLSFIAYSVQLAIYSLARHDYLRNFFLAHVSSKIIDIDTHFRSESEIVLLSFMLYLSSIVFHGVQNLTSHDLVFSIILEIRKVNYYLYYYISWIFIFAFSIVNQYPSLLKFVFLLFFSFGTLTAKNFFKIRLFFIFLFSIFIITQFVFHLFVNDLSEKSKSLCTYIGVFFTDGEITNQKKNAALIWQLAFMLLSMINSPKFSPFAHPEHIERKNIKRLYNGICGALHYLLPVLINASLYACVSFNGTIFCWFCIFVLLLSSASRKKFTKAFPIILSIILIYFLIQYLFYLQFPYKALDVKWWSAFNYIPEKHHLKSAMWFEFLGVYRIKKSSLITTCYLAITATFYWQFVKRKVNYEDSHNKLPIIIKKLVEIFVSYIFEICITLILVCASITRKPDGLVLFVFGSFFFTSSLLFDYKPYSTISFINHYIYVITFLRILSRLPFFVDTPTSNFVIRLFDLPLSGSSSSSNLWIIMFTLLEFCKHVLRSNLYKRISEQNIKRYAYRFIRGQQLKIIEKLDQDILFVKRSQEIKSLNNKSNLNEDSDFLQSSNSNFQLIKAENQSTSMFTVDTNSDNCYRKQEKFKKFYKSWIEPQLIRFARLMSTTLPINQEAGINILTLESLTLLMRKCLNRYEKNLEFHLEERERQFLLSLPPSFSFHFSSIYHLIDNQPFIGQDPTTLFGRYFSFLIRKISLPLLVLISIIYLYVKPYIFSIIIFAYVVCIFCSYNFSGFPNAYRIYFTIVLMLMSLRAVSCTDMVSDRLLSVSLSLTNIQSSISTLSIIGLDPGSSSICEILLFIVSIFYISDKLSTVSVYPPNYYFEKFSSLLPGFPMEYCYGIMDDPVHNFGMHIPQTQTFWRHLKKKMSKVWLRSTVHHNFILLLNAMSFIILLVCWSDWENGSNIMSPNSSYVFKVNVLFIFILIIDLIFMIIVYFCCLGELYFHLSFAEILWLLYSLSMIFFYIRSRNSETLRSAQFFIFIRILQHLIAAHACYVGRSNISYRYPEFSKDWKRLKFINKFIRYCPFAFEIQCVLLWIGKKTEISFRDFLVVRIMELQLEIQICNQMDTEKRYPKRHVCQGICLLFLFICTIFIPMTFLLELTSDTIENKVLLAQISAGVGILPPFYEATGIARQITNDEHNELARNNNSDFSTLASQKQNTLYIVDFPLYSSTPYLLSEEVIQSINSLYDSQDITKITFYVKYTIFFQRPTTPGRTLKGVYTIENGTLDISVENPIFSILKKQEGSLDSKIKIPRILHALLGEEMAPLFSSNSEFNFVYEVDSWKLNISEYDKIGFIGNETSMYRIVVYSSNVFNDLRSQDYYDMSEGEGFAGIYILMVIILGIAIRETLNVKVDSLWRERIDNPIKIYRMIIAINMFKNARDMKGEKEMCNLFLNTLKSHKKTLDAATKE